MRILGIDPGTATTGYGVIDLSGQDSYGYIASGIIKTTNDYTQSERLRMIRADMVEILETYSPDIVAVESIFFFKNAKTLVPVAQARGVILEAAASSGITIVEYTPMQVKMNIAGYGRADKKEMQVMVAKLLDSATVIKPDDASDAVAIAICHARSHTIMPCKQATV
ncbi:MAG: crossover junction endodeoxyribonuclease RuvC [Candidatus Obscuribacterales bacterium]|nr:crossover junction endodeoxyribonuclease RuvC [Candidatus Obscuribacterales bacterium]